MEQVRRASEQGAAEMRQRAASLVLNWEPWEPLQKLAEAILALPVEGEARPVEKSLDAVVERVVREGLDVARVEVPRPHLAAGQTWRDSKRREISVQEDREGLLACLLPFGQRVYFFDGAAAPEEWTFVGAPAANPRASEVASGKSEASPWAKRLANSTGSALAPADGLIGVDAGGGL
ncbi:hypothetical protein [Sorangium sp. So ce124]|uniref:hypothetical protein n=1 Tax=Sorangium sp. So ce124 TaxID=3133280 RepID=UPI003F610D94